MSDFGSLDLEEVVGEGNRLKSKGGNNFLDQFLPMPEVKPGSNATFSVRILPPVKGGRLYQYNRTHKLNGRSIHCPVPLVNGKWDRKAAHCPICEFYAAMWKQIEKLQRTHGKDSPEVKKLRDEASKLKAQERYYYNAVGREVTIDGKLIKNLGPRILSVGKQVHGLIIEAITGREGDPDSKLGNITDIKNGFDLVLRIEVTAGDGYPKYDKSGFARNPSVAGTPEEVAKWAASLHDLTKLRNPKDTEYLEKQLAIHRGLIPDETEGTDIEAFDSKWRRQGDAETVEEIMKHTPGGVSVPELPPFETDSGAAAETSASSNVGADVSIEDDEFLKELEGMES